MAAASASLVIIMDARGSGFDGRSVGMAGRFGDWPRVAPRSVRPVCTAMSDGGALGGVGGGRAGNLTPRGDAADLAGVALVVVGGNVGALFDGGSLVTVTAAAGVLTAAA